VLRSLEQQRAETRSQQIEDVRSIVQDFGDSHELSAPTASGMFVLLTEIIQSLLQDQLRSFLWATAGIFLCMTAAFRSVRIGVISLFPNIFPVALLLGSLGWADVPVNIGTAMISSVSMGLTVDSTIHYIFAFERARKTMTVSEALQHAHASAGRAVVFAHMALIAGFLVLTASRFIPLVYFGGLMSLSMFWGVFGDLVLLPLLLRWTTRVSSSATTV
jgi:predicted RND superfamily exporter protein